MDTNIVIDGQGTALTAASCYRALAAKDARFDGVFFTGVKTTGIYCRPVCGVKTPRESSCVFFSTAAAAEAAGFRPCLRCRPELAPYALQQNLAHAVWQRIAAGALNDGDTERLSKEVGLSSRQLRRVLLQHFGVTPIELAQTQRLLFAKKLLQETHLPMSDVAYAAGFGSIRRFNALFLARYGMAPTAIRRAVETPSHHGLDAITLRLAYRPPFAWTEMLRYLAGRAIPGVEVVAQDRTEEPCYMRSIRLGDAIGWLGVRHLPVRNQIELSLSASLAHVLMPLVARVRNQFDLDANPEVIATHLADDPLLAAQLEKSPGLRVPGAFDVFELATRAVLGQQVSVAGATTLSGRMVTHFGDAAATPFVGVTHHFPTSTRLAQEDVTAIAAIGMPATRAEAIRNLAQFAVQGGLQPRPGTALHDVVADLKSVRGIGEWTAQYIAMRALRYTDAFPAGDLGLQKAAIEMPDATNGIRRLTEKQLLARAMHWSPWRGYAALLLWHSLG
ncbi:MAG TPA: AlkA N-terminal domain-containing protein [Oxalicibacterium sp.]|uniref:AlkA N-terminal domain-containing protein n=1 Tax=Oxalicibacterium sp. TaxID=2766525 RepID=UPI002C35B7BC|nr:AlkA N-terminal domain-containing protein [Oxalicibacterium sp.]HWU98294.1 AlkA N-terminal domain-containing protein [Oxalicibacterium sp.]